MKILICVDIYGICGVDNFSQTNHNNINEYQETINYLMLETNAAVKGAFNGGASEVYVVNAHMNANHLSNNHLNIHKLNNRAHFVANNHGQFSLQNALSLEFKQLFFIGFHEAGGRFGTLPHTIDNNCFSEILINNTIVGETELYGLLAGEYGTAVSLITGADNFLENTKKLFTFAETVTTKTYNQQNSLITIHKPKHAIYDEIEQAAEKAVAENTTSQDGNQDGFIKKEPLVIKEEITLHVVTTNVIFADLFMLLPLVKRTGTKKLEFKTNSIKVAVQLLHAMSAMSASITKSYE